MLKSSKPHKNIIAGIKNDDLKKSKTSNKSNLDQDVVIYISKNPDFNYKEFDPTNADFKTINIDIRVPFISNRLTPVYEYIKPHVTDNTIIAMPFRLEDSNLNVENFIELLDSTKKLKFCLCEQEYDDVDRILNKWTVYFPAENQEIQNSVRFELQSFYRAFLGIVNYEINLLYILRIWMC